MERCQSWDLARKTGGKHHLKALERFFAGELRHPGVLLADKPGGLTGSEKRVKLPDGIGTGRVDRGEGRHIGGIAAGISGGVCEVAILGMQSVPRGIYDHILRQVVIRLKMHGGVAAPGWQDCAHKRCGR